jgi:hypothetical protein
MNRGLRKRSRQETWNNLLEQSSNFYEKSLFLLFVDYRNFKPSVVYIV